MHVSTFNAGSRSQGATKCAAICAALRAGLEIRSPSTEAYALRTLCQALGPGPCGLCGPGSQRQPDCHSSLKSAILEGDGRASYCDRPSVHRKDGVHTPLTQLCQVKSVTAMQVNKDEVDAGSYPAAASWIALHPASSLCDKARRVGQIDQSDGTSSLGATRAIVTNTSLSCGGRDHDPTTTPKLSSPWVGASRRGLDFSCHSLASSGA